MSPATIDQSFLVMNIVKARFNNKIKDKYMADSLKLYIEKEIGVKLIIVYFLLLIFS
jgi:hypothetical protein